MKSTLSPISFPSLSLIPTEGLVLALSPYLAHCFGGECLMLLDDGPTLKKWWGFVSNAFLGTYCFLDARPYYRLKLLLLSHMDWLVLASWQWHLRGKLSPKTKGTVWITSTLAFPSFKPWSLTWNYRSSLCNSHWNSNWVGGCGATFSVKRTVGSCCVAILVSTPTIHTACHLPSTKCQTESGPASAVPVNRCQEEFRRYCFGGTDDECTYLW